MSLVFINDEYVSSEKAMISVFDRGFLFSDSVYEVVQVFEQKLFLFQEHIDRLHRSLKELSIPLPKVDWLNVAKHLLEHQNIDFGGIYIQISRGQQNKRSHAWEGAELKPTVVAFAQELLAIKSKTFKVITYPDLRWQRCDIKTNSLLPNALAMEAAKTAGCGEALLVNEQENVNEASCSNLFIVKNNRIITPALKENILPGITRKFCLDLLTEMNLNYSEEQISKKDLFDANEVWLTSATKDVVPITHIDDQAVNFVETDSVWQKVNKAFKQKKMQSLLTV